MVTLATGRSVRHAALIGLGAASLAVAGVPTAVAGVPTAVAAPPVGAASLFPPGVYGIIAVPTVPLKPHWTVDLKVLCSRTCRGTLSLRSEIGSGTHRRLRTITSSAHFTVAAAQGGSVAVPLRLNQPGRAAFRASHRDLLATAVMRYAAINGYRPQTDTYPVTVT
jgi:hypothetical protein